MGFDVRRVDRHRADPASGAGQRIEDIRPDALSAPAVEAIIDRRVRAVVWRTISPPRTTSQHMQDATDDAPIIDPVRAAPATRHQRLNPFPFRIGKPIQLSRHQSLHQIGNLESHLRARWNLY